MGREEVSKMDIEEYELIIREDSPVKKMTLGKLEGFLNKYCSGVVIEHVHGRGKMKPNKDDKLDYVNYMQIKGPYKQVDRFLFWERGLTKEKIKKLDKENKLMLSPM